MENLKLSSEGVYTIIVDGGRGTATIKDMIHIEDGKVIADLSGLFTIGPYMLSLELLN